jgi:hypothetical protein
MYGGMNLSGDLSSWEYALDVSFPSGVCRDKEGHIAVVRSQR